MSKKELSRPYFKAAPTTVYRSPELVWERARERAFKGIKVNPDRAMVNNTNRKARMNTGANQEGTANRPTPSAGEQPGSSNGNAQSRKPALQPRRRTDLSKPDTSPSRKKKTVATRPERHRSSRSGITRRTGSIHRSNWINRSSLSGEKLSSQVNELEWVDDDLGRTESEFLNHKSQLLGKEK